MANSAAPHGAESKAYLDWQWEGRPAEGELVQIYAYGQVGVGYWLWQDAGDREHDEHLVEHWFCLAGVEDKMEPIDGVPDAWMPLAAPPPQEFGWEVHYSTAVYHNGRYSHILDYTKTVIASTADEARKLVQLPAEEDKQHGNLRIETISRYDRVELLGRAVRCMVTEFLK